jgi:hypothetical protein
MHGHIHEQEREREHENGTWNMECGHECKLIILKTGMSECNAGEKFSKSTKHAEIGNLFERILLQFLNPFLSRVRRPCRRTMKYFL